MANWTLNAEELEEAMRATEEWVRKGGSEPCVYKDCAARWEWRDTLSMIRTDDRHVALCSMGHTCNDAGVRRYSERYHVKWAHFRPPVDLDAYRRYLAIKKFMDQPTPSDRLSRPVRI